MCVCVWIIYSFVFGSMDHILFLMENYENEFFFAIYEHISIYKICIFWLYIHMHFFVLMLIDGKFAGRGIYILYEDVKSCPYEDVQVLWSILVESHPHTLQLKQ